MGNSQNKETGKRFAMEFTKLAVSSAVAGAIVGATGGLAIPMGDLIYTEGWILSRIAEESDSQTTAEIAALIKDVGVSSALGGVIGESSRSLVSQSTKFIGREASKQIAINGVSNSTHLLISAGKTVAELAKDLRDIEKFMELAVALMK